MPRRSKGARFGLESGAADQRSGSSSITAANSAQARAKMISKRLKTRSPNI